MTAPPGARLPNERDQTAQGRQVEPSDKLKRAARDQQSGREDPEARWRAEEQFSANTRPSAGKPGRPVIVRKRMRI